MPLHYEKHGNVAKIVLDNPPVNVFTPELHRELYRILQDFVADDAIHVGVWTGAGERSFCAGDDIKTKRPERSAAELITRELSVRHDGQSPEYPGWESEILNLTRYKPIVAAINGHCLGQGFIFMMHLSDIRIAATNANFGCPEIAHGMGGAGGMMRLLRMIPHSSAMWLLLSGETFNAEEALRHFVVNEVVAPEKLQARALQVAERIASHPPLAVRTEMEASYRASDMSAADARAFTSHLYRLQRVALGPELPLKPEPQDDG